ncbi:MULTISPECIES: hypothetical protein [unclassified Inquilinus]|uniref:hypothetical protein n=1 Tax=unclassified Inquilinus TaxID=2645927 RepID=UPI003F8F63AF
MSIAKRINITRDTKDMSLDGYDPAFLAGEEFAKLTIYLPVSVVRAVDKAAEMNGVSTSRFMMEVLAKGARSALAPTAASAPTVTTTH